MYPFPSNKTLNKIYWSNYFHNSFSRYTYRHYAKDIFSLTILKINPLFCLINSFCDFIGCLKLICPSVILLLANARTKLKNS